VIGTTTQLFSVDTSTPAGTVRSLADGSFARVVIAMTDAGPVAIAIQNRGASAPTCATTARAVWAPLDGSAARMVATGGSRTSPPTAATPTTSTRASASSAS